MGKAKKEQSVARAEIKRLEEEIRLLREADVRRGEELKVLGRSYREMERELEARNSELERAQRFSEKILRTVHHPLVVLDSALRVKAANRAFYETFRTLPVSTLDQLFFELGDGVWDTPELRWRLAGVAEKDEFFQDVQVEGDFPVIGRRIIWLDARSVIQEERLGEELILVAMEDMTDHMRSVEEREEQYRLLQSLADALPNPISYRDRNRCYLGCNKAFEQFAGLRQQDVIGRTAYEIFPKDQAEMITAGDLDLSAGQTAYEGVLRRSGGDPREVFIQKATFLNHRGQPIGTVETITDITEPRRAQRAIKESERFARRTLDSLTAHVAILDADGKIISVNESWASFAREHGQGRDQVGQNYLWVCKEATGEGADEAKAVAEGIRRVIDEELDEFSLEYACHSPTENRWFHLRATPFAGEGPVRVVVAHEDITDRKLVEQERRESAFRMHFVGQNMPALLEAFDENRNIIFWNKEAERVSGYTSEEIVGNPRAMEILYPEKTYRERMLEEIKERGHDFRDWEWQMTSKDGSVRIVTWFNVSKHFPISGWNSWALGVDITERKKAEATLRESQERFKGAFYDVAFGMSIFDLDGRFLEVNTHLCKMLGYSEIELLQKSIYDITHPNDRELSRKRVEAILEGGQIDSSLEKRYIHKNGGTIWVAISSSPIRDPNGDPLYFVSHIQDISLRKRAETALTASERRFSLFMDNLPGLAYMKDQSGRYVYVNAFFNDLFDVHDHRGVLGTRDEDWFPPEYVGQYRDNEKAVMSKEQAMDFTETGTSSTGLRYWLSCKFPIFEEDNHPLLGAVSIDITDRVEAEQALEANRQELKIHADNLRDVNTALKVLLDERDQEKKKQVADIVATMEKLVFPYLERLKGTRLTNEQSVFLEVMESNMRDIASPFASHLTTLETRLTPAELEVAQLLRVGKTSEEIAELLHISVPTVSSHRSSIRRKLGLVNKAVNLKSYLRTIN